MPGTEPAKLSSYEQELTRLRTELDRVRHLHNLDHSLADQWRDRNDWRDRAELAHAALTHVRAEFFERMGGFGYVPSYHICRACRGNDMDADGHARPDGIRHESDCWAPRVLAIAALELTRIAPHEPPGAAPGENVATGVLADLERVGAAVKAMVDDVERLSPKGPPQSGYHLFFTRNSECGHTRQATGTNYNLLEEGRRATQFYVEVVPGTCGHCQEQERVAKMNADGCFACGASGLPERGGRPLSVVTLFWNHSTIGLCDDCIHGLWEKLETRRNKRLVKAAPGAPEPTMEA